MKPTAEGEARSQKPEGGVQTPGSGPDLTALERVAAAIANARGARRGAPALANVLAVLSPKLRAEVMEDAAAALTAAAAGPAPAEPNTKAPRYAQNWSELAAALQVTRRSIQNWRSRADLQGRLPESAPDGRKDIDAWKEAMVEHGLARADEDFAGEEDDDDASGGHSRPRSVKDWKMKREELLCTKIAREIAKDDQQLLEEPRLAVAFGQMLVGIAAALTHLPGSAARFLVGLKDPHVVQERLEAKMNGVLQRLNAAEYVEEDLAAVVRELDFDEEAEGLFAAVAFEGQDRGKLLELITIATRQVLQAIGRRGIAAALGEGDSKPEASEAVATSAEGSAAAGGSAEGEGGQLQPGQPATCAESQTEPSSLSAQAAKAPTERRPPGRRRRAVVIGDEKQRVPAAGEGMKRKMKRKRKTGRRRAS